MGAIIEWDGERISRLKYAMKIATWTQFAAHAQIDVRRLVELLEGGATTAEESLKLDHVWKSAGPDVQRLLYEPSDERFDGSMGSIPELTQDVAIALGAFGGARGIATILKTYFDRNNVKKVKFGPDGGIVEAEGLSADELVRLLESAGGTNPNPPSED